MGIVIRQADLIRDQQVMIETRNQNRTWATDERRYQWRYLDNPHGQAVAWLAIDERTEAVAGFTVAHPRRMSVGGEDVTCWNCGDFSINKRYRTLGVAVKLRSAATQCVNQGNVPFLYAHPNDRMKVVHLKAGHTAIGQMVRYARVLRLDRYMPPSMQASWVTSGLSWAYQKGVMTWHGVQRGCSGFSRELYEGVPDSAPFDVFQQGLRDRFSVFGLRSREYLLWRFGAHPLLTVSALLLYRGRDLVGYALYTCKDRVMSVVDFLYMPEPGVAQALTAHLTEVGWELKMQAISVTLFESNPLIQSLRNFGYALRPETSSVIVHTSPHLPCQEVLYDKAGWFMTVGDRDV